MLDLNNNKFTYHEEKQQAKRGSMSDTYEKEFNKEHELKILRANLKAVDDFKNNYKMQYNKKTGMFNLVPRRRIPIGFIYSWIAFGYTLVAVIVSAAFFPVAFRTFFGF